jgi:hypothetical protein
MWQLILSIIIAIVTMYGSIAYIICVVKGEAKPNRVSWLFWGIPATFSAIVLFIENGFDYSYIFIFITGLMPLITFFIALFCKQAYWKLSLFDYLCGTTAFIAFMCYIFINNLLISIIFMIITDLFASIPTLIKTAKHPESESIIIWFTSSACSCLNLLLVTNWQFIDYSYPIYLAIINLTTLITFIVARKFNKVK